MGIVSLTWLPQHVASFAHALSVCTLLVDKLVDQLTSRHGCRSYITHIVVVIALYITAVAVVAVVVVVLQCFYFRRLCLKCREVQIKRNCDYCKLGIFNLNTKNAYAKYPGNKRTTKTTTTAIASDG